MIGCHARDMDEDERRETHNAYICEYEDGRISGKEFVQRLCEVLGFGDLDAKGEWQRIKSLGRVAIYQVSEGARVYAPFQGKFFPAKIISFYGNRAGAVVCYECIGVPNAARVPFALYELRTME